MVQGRTASTRRRTDQSLVAIPRSYLRDLLAQLLHHRPDYSLPLPLLTPSRYFPLRALHLYLHAPGDRRPTIGFTQTLVHLRDVFPHPKLTGLKSLTNIHTSISQRRRLSLLLVTSLFLHLPPIPRTIPQLQGRAGAVCFHHRRGQ